MIIFVSERLENIMGKREKVLVIIIFSFSNYVFEGLLFQGGLTLYQRTNWKHLQTTGLAEKWKFVMGKVEIIVGNGENVGYQHFLLFPQCFQKASFQGLLKVGIVW